MAEHTAPRSPARVFLKRTALALAGVVLLLLIAYGVLAIRFWTGKPTLSRNVQQELTAAYVTPVPEGERAWPKYREAALHLPRFPIIDGEAHLSNNWPDVRPADPEYAAVVEHVRAAAPQLALARAAAMLESMGYAGQATTDFEVQNNMLRMQHASTPPPASAEQAPENPPAVDILLPHLAVMRQFGRYFAFDTRLALREDDAPRAVANIRAMLGISRQLAKEPFLISQLVGYALHALSVNTLMECLRDHADQFTDEDLALLAQELRSSPAPGRVQPTFESERLMMVDAVQRIYTDDGHGNGRLTPEGVRFLHSLTGTGESTSPLENVLMPFSSLAFASRRDTLDAYESLMTLSEQRRALLPWERLAPSTTTTVDQRFATMMNTPFARWRFQVLGVLVPALESASWTADQLATSRDAALCVIALHQFRREHNRWPASLDELVPRYLASLPLDMYTGKPLTYIPPSDGAQPLLYSIGNDLHDDGGIPHPTGEFMGGRPLTGTDAQVDADWIFWPVQDRPRN